MARELTVLFDNSTLKPELKSGWGFSALIEDNGFFVLFDTGNDGASLLYNMEKLKIDPEIIGAVVISHGHQDHTGGLSEILRLNEKAVVYIPRSCVLRLRDREVVSVGPPAQISEGILSLGELGDIEQSLIVKTGRGNLVVAGCSHPGVGAILGAAATYGKVFGIIGGFHGFSEYDVLNGLSFICPCHCTVNGKTINRLFPEQCRKCGAGLKVDLE